jgi:hypothetical protein
MAAAQRWFAPTASAIRALVAAAWLQAGCETPPDNSARYWEGSAVQAPAAGGSPSGEGGAGEGGAGGVVSSGQGGQGGRDGTGGVGLGGASGASAGGSGGGAGAGGAADAAGLPPPPDASGSVGTGTGCSMTVKLTTITTDMDYAPDNIGAVWIADAGGKFVKSLEVWANRRMSHLNKWVAATSAAGQPRDTVDAVTAATASKHLTHTSSWNCTASGGAKVPRGTYQLCIEMNESNSASIAYQCVKFDNAGIAFTAMPADAGYFKGRVIDYAPR